MLASGMLAARVALSLQKMVGQGDQEDLGGQVVLLNQGFPAG